jgi:hypothetical protein
LRRTSPIAVAATAVAVTLTACGGDEEQGTVESPGVDETSAAETGSEVTETSEGTPAGPEGVLTSSGVGEVSRGDSTDQVEELFGPADETQTGPGCELAPDSPGALAWTYDLGDGTLILSFDAASGELGFYRNTSPGLLTTLGDSVGEEFGLLQQNWGSSLEPFPIGEPTAKAGLWVVRDSAEEELLFEIFKGKVTAISGGDIQICE